MNRRGKLLGLTAVAVLTAAAGCARKHAPPPPAAPPEVTVRLPLEREYEVCLDFTARVTAQATVDVVARVKGTLQKVLFGPGAEVKKDALLFVIEPDTYQARLDEASASLKSAEADHQAAVEELAIKQEMLAKNAASKLDVVSAVNRRDSAAARILQARASIEQAKINLGYTQVLAPMDGKINRNLVDAGNLVGAAGGDTLLATIVDDDPVYAYFYASEREMLEHRDIFRTPGKDTPGAVARLSVGKEKNFPHEGRIDFVDNRVDPDTGTIQARAVFDNPRRALVSGLFGRVRVPVGKEKGLLVPDVAIASDQAGKYVWVVNEKSVVEQRRVTLGALLDEMRVVKEGVKAGDKVVVAGLLRCRPGRAVTPREPPADAGQKPAPGATPGRGQ